MREPGTQRFLALLARRRRAFRLGLLAGELMRTAGGALMLLSAIAVADFFMALPARVLLAADIAALAALAAMGAAGAVRSLRFSARDMALRADLTARDRRQDVLSALELVRGEAPPSASADLLRYLVNCSVARAASQLAALPPGARRPTPELRRQGRVLLAQTLIAALVLGASINVSRVVLARVLFPLRDLPPYSPYAFTLTPAEPRVPYGDTVEISADIDGPPVRDQVWLMTRYGGRAQRTPCFQESPRRFTQRLEKVVQPLEFCFATGRARSRWHRVDLLLEPRVVTARLRIVPPVYSGRPAHEFSAGEERLAGLKGSRAELDVACNRPLAEGWLDVAPAAAQAQAAVVRGERFGAQRMRFAWDVRTPARLSVTLRDLRGTTNQAPFVLEQNLIPDEPPKAVITEPAGFALATPTTRLPLAGYAEDDIGLTRVDLVRAVVGYRDRSLDLDAGASPTRLDIAQPLDLGKLGVEPGQELEFYIEAADGNPDLTGVGASDVVRVEVISEEDYAQLLRAQIRSEEFVARYRTAEAALTNLQRTVAESLDALTAGKLSEAQRREAWQKVRDANAQAARVMRQLADDFPVYEAERSLDDVLEKTAREMEEQKEWLAHVPPFEEGMQRTLKQIAGRLAGTAPALAQQSRQAEEIAAISRLMEEALRFRELLFAQESLVRRLEREGDPARLHDLPLFRLAQNRQSDVHERLVRLRDAIRDNVKALPAGYDALRETAREFADRIDALEIPPLMEQAAAGAQNQDGDRLCHNASLALERMKELLSHCEGEAFGGLSQCQLKFSVPDRLRPTLQQMLEAWGAGRGVGAGTGMGGIGRAGADADGYAVEGYSPLNIPTYGPPRSRLGSAGVDTGNAGGGDAGRAASRPLGAKEREAMHVSRDLDMERTAVPWEKAPEKYREALKRYFGAEAPKP